MRTIIGFFFIFLSSLSFAKDYKLLETDEALFRIKNHVYFYSQVESWIRSFDQFLCIHPDSHLMGTVDFSRLDARKNDLAKPTSFKGDEKKRRETEEFLKKVMKVLKLKHYASEQKVFLDPKVEKTMYKLAKRNGCLKKEAKQVSGNVLKLMRTEVFIQARYQGQSYWVREEEIKRMKKKKPQLSREKIIELEKKKKLNEAVKLFADTVMRQTSHEIFL